MLYLIEILIEFLSVLFLELLFSLGFRRLNDLFKHPNLTSILFGTLSGLVSLIFFDEILISNYYLQIANLLITPLALGTVMMLVGKIYDKFETKHSSLDSFSAGFCFGMAMTLVRYVFAG